MMLRRGTGGYYVNGVVARWPTDGISLRDAATYARAGNVATPSTSADLQVRNIYFAEMGGKLFQAPSATQFALDAAANNLTLGTATAASLFAAIPAVGSTPTSIAAFDFTPVAGSPIATGGLATFSGAMPPRPARSSPARAYMGGVAPAGPKWFQGWTSYARN